MELLAGRLAVERAAVELYDAVLERLGRRSGPFTSIRTHLRLIREEEKSHEEWLEEKLSSLGGDVDARATRLEPPALAEGAEPAQLFQTLLRAELSDTAGWELLVELAERAQDPEALEAFTQRLHEEQEHLLFLGHLVAVHTNGPAFDATMTMLEDASA
ncbi:MAG: ferritin-like domain-containing protein [Myxococcales bacterium]